MLMCIRVEVLQFPVAPVCQLQQLIFTNTLTCIAVIQSHLRQPENTKWGVPMPGVMKPGALRNAITC